MRPRPTLSKSLGSVCLAPVRSSTNLPSVSFQSLTNCLCFATHSEILSFQPITNCPIFKSFVLITIQQCRGWVGPLCFNFPTFKPANLSTFHVPYILPSSVYANSFVCHSYENCRGVYAFFPIWNGPNQLSSSAFTPSFEGASTIASCADALLFHESPVTNHKSRFSDFPAAPNSSPFQSLLTDKNRLCYTEPVIGKLAS